MERLEWVYCEFAAGMPEPVDPACEIGEFIM
jgi:hypothetical protein